MASGHQSRKQIREHSRGERVDEKELKLYNCFGNSKIEERKYVIRRKSENEKEKKERISNFVVNWRL